MRMLSCQRQTHAATIMTGSDVQVKKISLNRIYVRDSMRVVGEGEGGEVSAIVEGEKRAHRS